MPERDRGHGFKVVTATTIALMLGLAIVAIFEAGRSKGVSEGEYVANADTYAKHADQEIEDRCLILDDPAKAICIREVVDAHNETERAERDLVAQSDMALWALIMLSVTALMAIITALGVWFVWRTLLATQKMAEDARIATAITREIGEAQVRAYISISRVSIAIDETAPHPKLQVVVKNAGQSPARSVEVVVEISCFPDPRKAVQYRHERQSGVMWLNDISAGEEVESIPTTLNDIRFDTAALGPNLESLMGIHMDIVVYASDVFGRECIAAGHFSSSWGFGADKRTFSEMHDFSSLGLTKYMVDRLRRKDGKRNQ